MGASLDKRRSVVLISRQDYAVRALVIAAPVSTKVRRFSVEVKVGKREGLPKSSVINCDSIVTIAKSAFVERVGTLSGAKRTQLNDALAFALGLDERETR